MVKFAATQRLVRQAEDDVLRGKQGDQPHPPRSAGFLQLSRGLSEGRRGGKWPPCPSLNTPSQTQRTKYGIEYYKAGSASISWSYPIMIMLQNTMSGQYLKDRQPFYHAFVKEISKPQYFRYLLNCSLISKHIFIKDPYPEINKHRQKYIETFMEASSGEVNPQSSKEY